MKYGCRVGFQRQMHQGAAEAFEIANNWQAADAPVFGGNRAE
jgi:hypothetical protein